MGHYYRFKRGDRVVIVSGQQRTIDHPEDVSPGYHVVLADNAVVTVRWDQVKIAGDG